MNATRLAGAAGVLLAIGIAAPAIAESPHEKPGGRDYDQPVTHECPDDDGSVDTIAYDGPRLLWPPNHKYERATITATGDAGEAVTVAATGTHDQMVSETEEMNGSGNTTADVLPGAPGAGTGSAATTVEIRKERSGRDDTGRTYDITVTADFGGTPCVHTFEDVVTVPHNMRPSNRG